MENHWIIQNGKLVKSVQFKNFKEALSFINKLGELAEQFNHHPKIINIYNQVSLELWTHDQNAITELDYKLAEEIDKLTL
ncbi:MAG: pterin-4-alpha-carbinolamine dehydratase [Flavobacteriales bacterium MED-G15]|jgi:4a-hydroxytetrahydrobiopterin dehydratase|nr:MAG: pterin-4-alpha-carbinolamine dehydratase [Flavobacteriales bacterium MED-G15]|tara:strand:- start:1401 stop:1640 length:240 start_codon:yes stop_codon:yes gene_type:complete